MNILWLQPNQTLALTSIFEDVDPLEYAGLLKERGDIPADWALLSANVDWPETGAPHEAHRWDGEKIIVDPAFVIAHQWGRIQAERDRRRFDGGVEVGGHWFPTTSAAIGEYGTLLLMSTGLPDTAVLRAGWETMDGATVELTPALVKAVLAAGLSAVTALDDAALAHKAAMEISGNPAAYNYFVGWPKAFGEI